MSNIVYMNLRESSVFKINPISIYVSFSYSIEALDKVKKIDEKFRKYQASSKEWEVCLSHLDELMYNYQDFKVVMNGNAHTESPTVVAKRVSFADTSGLDGFEFKTAPFPHQIEGLIFGKNKPKFLLADDQGLGKTKQAIDLAVSRKSQFKHCLIVCGVNSVKYNWLQEIETHSNETGYILGSYINTKGVLKDDGPLEHRLDDLESDLDDFFLITNIETLRQPAKKKESAMSKMELTQQRILDRVEELTRTGVIGMVIIDEMHKAKNPTSMQGKAIHKLMSHYKMALTGTPIINNPIDAYNILKWLEVESHSLHQFKSYYCILNSWKDVVGYKNLEHLKERLDGVMLRRKKDEVLNLPPKIKQLEYVEMKGSQLKLYKDIRDELIRKIDELVLDSNPLAMLTRLRQVTSYPQILSQDIKESAKIDRVEEMIQEMIESGQKAIIFSNWSKVTNAVKERLARFNPAYIDGNVSDRMGEVNKFQKDDSCHIIIGTIGAMGTGLTLTAASNVIFMDKPWDPSNTAQAEDRAHRIGTKGTVNVYTMVARDSIDFRIEQLIEKKQDIIDGLVEGNFEKLNKVQVLNDLLS